MNSAVLPDPKEKIEEFVICIYYNCNVHLFLILLVYFDFSLFCSPISVNYDIKHSIIKLKTNNKCSY